MKGMPKSVQYESLVKAILRTFPRQISFYISFILNAKYFVSKKLGTCVLE